MKTKTTIFCPAFTVFALVCFAFVQNAQAVSPAPDGGYPGGNTAEGQNALFSLTSGGYNTALGFFSLRSDTSGQLNTAIGAGALLANTGDQNTATGAGALLSNTTGLLNTANGAFALFSNTTGFSNTANGFAALFRNTTGLYNTANGDEALYSNTTGPSNTATGYQALNNNTTNGGSTATGYQALLADTGFGNTAHGYQALTNNTTGFANTALGANAGSSVITANNVICIGTAGENVSNSCYIGNIFTFTSSGGVAVFINSDGKLGTTTSSRRFKEEIKPMERASEALFALKPVTFRYKKGIDPQRIPQFGLVAEEVEQVNADLIVRDKEGKPYSVRYDAVNAMLLNEFLKEHRKVEEQSCKIENQDRKIEEQQTTITQLKKEMETVIAHSKEQDAQIQTVSDQVQITKPTLRVAAENP